MRSVLFLIFFLCLASGVLATSVMNVPELAERDMVVRPGLHREYNFPVGGANLIAVSVETPPALQPYVTVYDPAPNQGPRMIKVVFDFPDDVAVPPNIYTIWFNANEIPEANSQISTSVSISFGFVLRSYSAEPLLEITDVQLDPVPNGTRGTFTARIISRTLATIPEESAEVDILDEQGNIIATGYGTHGALASGEQAVITGTIDTRSLPGGLYRSNTIVTYGNKEATYNKSILRVGTLTIDLLDDYTKSFTFNQTNKFQFQLKSNWNKPLTRVAATVNLLGQSKRSPEQTIAPFGTSDTAEVYFDRTETPPGPVEGTMVVTYQELSPNPGQQDSVETHTFTIPIHVNIDLPPAPAKVKKEWHITTTQLIIGAIAIIVLINIVLIVLLLRKPKSSDNTGNARANSPGSVGAGSVGINSGNAGRSPNDGPK
jgi:hypothetical protein